jgi:hypothetical protein
MARRACRSVKWRGVAVDSGAPGRVVMWAPIGPKSSHLFFAVRPEVARVLLGQRVDAKEAYGVQAERP